jgi:peptidoglycan hydrolase-like protein with peptidoglycan-binding domain/DNA invertase Pin-like site-specific DNA recombinase
MRRTYPKWGARAGLVALGAAVILLGLPLTASAQGGGGGKLLAPGAGYAGAESAREVKSLQRALQKLGWQPGPVDGFFGPRTADATEALQRAVGLVPDGIVGPRTSKALESALRSPLRRGAGYAQPDGSPRVRALQSRLQRRGVQPGPVDGVFGPRTQAAVERVQRDGGVSVNGIVGPATERLLAEASIAPEKERANAPASPQAEPDQARGGGNEGAQTRSDSRRELRIRNTENAEAAASDDSNFPLILALAALAIALAGLVGVLFGRLGPATAGLSAPLVHGLIAEGRSRASSIGQFRGPVHALVIRRRRLARREETHYLVSDPEQPKPFWVDEQEVASLVAASPEQAQEEPAPDDELAPPAPMRALAAVPEPAAEDVQVLGYVSVRETEAIDGSRPQEQMEAINSLCDQRGWKLLEIVRDREEPRGTALERPGLGYALERLESGQASCLIVSELLRLSRSVADLGRILDTIDNIGGRLIALDVDVDTATREGRKAVDVLLTVSGWERQRLADRTRRGLEAARAKGARSSRPSVADLPALNKWIVELRESGMTLQAIADRLNAEGVPTLRGGAKWRPSSVQAAAGYRRPRRGPRAVGRDEPANDEMVKEGRG